MLISCILGIVSVYKKRRSPNRPKFSPSLNHKHRCLTLRPDTGVNTMIREKALRCKLFSQKETPAEQLAGFMRSYDPMLERCPCCYATGTCKRHAYYSRYLIGFSNGRPECQQVSILRVICTSCRHTHAILPDFIIPFRQFSLPFILKVLHDYFTHRSLSRIRNLFGVSYRLLTTWRKLFQSHKLLWLGILKNEETTSADFLARICDSDCPSDFFSAFYGRLKRSLLQAHANPTANYDGCALDRKVSGSPTTQL